MGTVQETGELLFLLVLAAAGGAIAASLFRLPKIAGYLLAGALIGPAGFGLVTDPEQTRFVAEFGVALLLFVVGVELSLRELLSSLWSALLIGLGELTVVGAATFIGAQYAGLSAEGSLLLAGAAGFSSTAAVLSLLGTLGERGQRVAPVVVAVLIVQDVVAIVLIGAASRLTAGGGTAEFLVALGRIVGAIAAIAVALPLLSGLVHYAFRFVARQVDRELFLITVIASIGIIAALSLELGLSIALGAFVAGLVISESGYADQALAEVRALSSVFAAAFFVSAGLLLERGAVTEELDLLLVLFGSAVVVKFAAITLLARLARWSWRRAAFIGLLLANAGEFSFAVAEAASLDVVPAGPRGAMVLVVLGSLLLTSVVSALFSRGALPAAQAGPADVVLIGYGRLGRQVASLLRSRGIGVYVVERDADLARLAAEDGFPAFWGDANQRPLLRRLGRGRVYLVTPTGQVGADLVDTLAELAPGSRVIATTAPEGHLSRLGLDLTIVDVDRPAAEQVVAATERALTTAAQPYTVRSAAGTFRFAFGRAPKRPPWWRRGAPEWVRSVRRTPDFCSACEGRGRRLVEGRFVTCSVCGGDGRRTPLPGAPTTAGTRAEHPQRSGREGDRD